jgi:AraC family transcriptional regulator
MLESAHPREYRTNEAVLAGTTALDLAGRGRESSGNAAQRGALPMSIVIRLLNSADQAMSRDEKEARQCIADARALLRAECDLGAAKQSDASAHPARGCLAPWQMSRVAEFVQANLASPIRIRDCAAVVRLSPSHFSRAFKSSVGESPYVYLVRRRIERAQEMMLLTDKPLAQIALDCGLADQSHLTRLFRRIVGVSPAVWRRLRRGTVFERILLPTFREGA